MTFHVLAFTKDSVPVGSTYQELVPLTDAAIPMKNPGTTQRAWLSEDAHIFAGFAGGGSLTRARFSTGWLPPAHVRPIWNAQYPADLAPMGEWLNNPIKLPAMQEIVAEAIHSSGSVQNISMVLFITRGLAPAPKGPVTTLRATSTTATVANTWTEVSLSWEYSLTAGEFAVVGSEAVSGASIAHRWIFDNAKFRPGSLSVQALYNRPMQYAVAGMLGTWGTFRPPVMPRLEVFSPAPDSSHTAYLHVVRR